MPIPEHLRMRDDDPMREDDDVESMEPQAGHDMIEYLDERRDRQAQMRRQRALAFVTGALAVIAAFLAVSNLILLRQVGSPQPVRVVGARPFSTPGPAEATTPAAPASGATRTTPESSAARPGATARDTASTESTGEAASRDTVGPGDTARSTPELPADGARRTASAPGSRASTSQATSEARGRGEPPAATAARTAPVLAPTDHSATSSDADDPDPARRTAHWLVQTYGRLDAESRAASVVDFYSGEERAFWRRVLAAVRSEH